MRTRRTSAALLVTFLAAFLLVSCGGGGGQGEPFVTVLDADPTTLDPLNGTDAADYRLQQLIFNALVRKNEKFEYVGDLASDYKISEDGLTATFTLHENVVFHDGKPLTSADAKYTFEHLVQSKKKKSAPFSFPSAGGGTETFISSIETPDPRTLVFRLRRPWNQMLPNLVAVPVIPEGSGDTQAQSPVGTGPFRFVSRDESQKIWDLAAFDRYWQGPAQIKNLRVRTILDANTLQAELQSGRVDLVSGAANLSPDAYKSLGQDPSLKVLQFPGANIVYLGFNTETPPVNNPKVRQAISYAINRESLVRDLMLGQARIAHSILPESSWAYDAGQIYNYDPARAKQLLDEAGFRDPDGDGPRMRFDKPVVFKISSGNAAVSQYVGVIQNALRDVGIPASIEPYETPTLIEQLRNGQFQMTTLRWVGGNQDPSFLRDLFHSSEIPKGERKDVRNRSRYSNPELDRILDQALSTMDRQRAKELYVQAQQIISRDVPMLPLWYPDIMVIARENVGNVAVDASNDFSFLRKVTVEGR